MRLLGRPIAWITLAWELMPLVTISGGMELLVRLCFSPPSLLCSSS